MMDDESSQQKRKTLAQVKEFKNAYCKSGNQDGNNDKSSTSKNVETPCIQLSRARVASVARKNKTASIAIYLEQTNMDVEHLVATTS